MRRKIFFVLPALLVLFATGAFGQWGQGGRTPRDGACFYADTEFRGRSFCLNAGESQNRLPSEFDDRISSIQIFGRATVTVFDDPDFQGDHDRLDQNAPDLRSIRKSQHPDHTWNDRITSVRVDGSGGGRGRGNDDRGRDNGWNRDRDRDNWNRDHDRDDWNRDRNTDQGLHWGRGAQPRDGACFFRQPDFRGDYFCVARGTSIADLPREFNDTISSVRIFGSARVLAFSNSDFRGSRAGFDRDVRDLRDRREDRDWNNRISSLQVR